MLVLDEVTYTHAGQQSGYRFNMEAAPSEVTAVRGASGSGKSTLLDLIAGFLTPASGRLTLDGVDLAQLPPERRPVSILFQSESLFEHLSAADNIGLGLPARVPRTERDRRIAAALAEVGLDGIGPQRAETLSGGQKQRVALARTLLRDRPVLLLDEPFSALDDDTRVATRRLVAELTARHRWITVLVSHHADDIAALARRTYRIESGELVGEPQVDGRT
jgi:thiamine transport system ATP-binding protein